MANKLVWLRQISASSAAEGDFTSQKIILPINGLIDGAGVAIDNSEVIYVSDSSLHIIFKYRRGSTASTVFAGSTGVSGLVDGQGSTARFNTPTYMACSPSGDIYVVDSGNNRIRRITPNANVYTVAEIPAVGLDQIGGITVDKSGNIYLIDNS